MRVNAMMRDQLSVSRGGDSVQQHRRSRPPGSQGASPRSVVQCPWQASKQVLPMAGARELVCCVCVVSVSRALRPSKLAAMACCHAAMQPCLGQACQVCPAKVCIATFGGFLTFAQPRNIEPSGWRIDQ